MRINFLGHFKEVEKLTRSELASQTVSNSPNNFEKLLADIAPKSPQIAIKSENLNLNAAAQTAEQSSPLASLKIPAGQQQAPMLAPLEAIVDPHPSLEVGANSVKTPTLLDARRIPSALADEPKHVRIDSVRKMVSEAGKKHGIDPALSMAVVSAESSFNPLAVSSDGHASKGLFQLLDKTGNYLHKNTGAPQNYDPFNPELNVDLGVGYLRYLHDIFSRTQELTNKQSTIPAANYASLEKLAVAAFNAGEGRVAFAQARAIKAGQDPAQYDQVRPYLPGSTQEYVERVLSSKANFESTEEQS